MSLCVKKVFEIKYYKFKIFLFLTYVLFTESIFWALVISPFAALNEITSGGYLYNLFIGVFYFSVAFIWAKTLFELWVIFIVALFISKNKKEKINKKIIIESRKIVIVLYIIITFIGIPLEHQEPDKIIAGITLLPLAYILQMYIPYQFTKKHLKKLYAKFLIENENST